MIQIRSLAIALALVFGASAASAATLNVVGGQLLGASGVDVGGQLYDVEFVDGTCIALFDGCNEAADFVFQTSIEALTASQALLDQVFVNGVAGAFDDDPSLTSGCTALSRCQARTPYTIFLIPGDVDFAYAQNTAAPGVDAVGSGYDSLGGSTAIVGGGGEDQVYARWSLVPEPGTGLLMAAGLALLSARRRRVAGR